MSLRHGITAPEEHKLKTLIAKGASWDDIVARCQVEDDRGNPQTPLFADVNLEVVRKNVFEPLVKKHEEAKKAGFKDIHAHEAKLKKERDAAAAAKKAKESEDK
jgi:hypothetical protein